MFLHTFVQKLGFIMTHKINNLNTNYFRITENLLEEFSIGTPTVSRSAYIILCEQGLAEIQVNLSKVLLQQDEVLCLFPSDTVSICRKSPDFRVLCFTFSDEFMCMASVNIENVVMRFMHANFHLKPKPESLTVIKRWFYFIKDMFITADKEVKHELMLMQLRCIYLGIYSAGKKWIRENGIKYKETLTRSTVLFHKFVELTIKYSAREREVNFYADKMCISSKYLNTIVKEIEHKTAKEYIDERVITQLKIKIRTSTNSIQEISDEFRFTNQSHLGRYFKRLTGMTISEYKKQKFSNDYS